MKKITVCSFFSGAGGLDLGLEGDFSVLGKHYPQTGLETIFSCDILPFAKTCFDNFWKDRNGLEMTQASIVDLVKQKKLPKADIVTGGFPCQDFSVAGKRGGFNSHKNHKGELFGSPNKNESRGMLYYWLARSIELIQPKMFIAENVKGILSIPGAVDIIKSDFTKLGYTVQVKLLFAPDYGVPQNRERVIFIGVRNKSVKNKNILKQIKSGDFSLHPSPTVKNYRTCQEAFKGLKEPSESLDPSQQSYSKAKRLLKGQGQNEVLLDKQAPTIRAEHHGNIEFRRLSKSHGGKNKAEYNLPERRLTVRECARLQTFPDNYSFVQEKVSAASAYKVIGNAVPVLMAYEIGSHLEKIFKKLF